MTPRRGAARAAVGALLLAVSLGLVACTGAVAPDPTSTGSTRAPTFSGVRHPLPTGSALASDPDLYGRVDLTKCAATSDGWKAEGTMKNPGTATVTAAIVVLFTDAQARAIDSATVEVDARAGRTSSWTAHRAFRAPMGTRCVIRAVHAS